MLAEALDKLVTLAQEAQNVKLLPLNEYLSLEFLPGKPATVRELPPKPITRKLDTFDAFATYVAMRADMKVEGERTDVELTGHIAHEGSVIFFSEKEFAYHEQPNLHTGLKATFALKKSEPFLWLERDAAKFLNQADFVRTLRITLRDVLPPGNLLGIVREIKFTNNSSGASAVQHGKQSLSREIINEVKGTGALPEEIVLNLQPFENVAYKCNVLCAIEIDEQSCAFRLTAYPGQLRKCIDTVLDMANQQLSEAGIPTHQGQVS